MISRRRLLASTGAAIATSAVLAACGGSSSGGGGSTGGSSGGASGMADLDPNGVIHLEQTQPFEFLDPQQIYVNNSSSFARFIYRTLMGWNEKADGTFELAPDLADGMPTNADGGKTWTFKVRSGIKYSDGSAITAADIKYGVERSMDAQISNGPQYAKLYLAGADSYTGPGKDKSKQLASIETPDDTTIVFKLKQPVAYWDQLCTLYTFTPVPKAKDTGTAYDLNPVTMGPYKFQQYDKENRIVLAKDSNWSADTGSLVHQNFQSVEVSMGVDQSQLDNDLVSDTNNGTNCMFSDDPAPATISRVQVKPLKDRTLTGTTIFVQYIAVRQNQPALKDVRVRQALMYALNPQSSIQAIGGPLLRAQLQSFAPPTLKGFEDVKPTYDVGDTGDTDKAKQLLQQAGVSNLTVTYPYANSGINPALAQTVVEALKRVGVNVVTKPLQGGAYYKTVSNLSSKYDLVPGGWGYDIPDGATIFPPIFQGGDNLYNGTSNLAFLDDPMVNSLIAKALAAASTDEALPFWQQVNKYVVDQALVLPRFVYKVAPIMGSKVKDAYISPVLGNTDVATRGYISKT